MPSAFDNTKKYIITVETNGETLTYTATNVKIENTLLSFTDKFGKQYIFPLTQLRQASEAKG